MRLVLCLYSFCIFALACGKAPHAIEKNSVKGSAFRIERINKSDAEWKKLLTPEQYHILRERGTERPFTGKFYNHQAKGIYTCAACGLALFSSATKFDSGTGWPSFFAPISPQVIEELTDLSHGMVRTEVRCARCGGHLGHLFEDGPKPTGLRYCINSGALIFIKD